MSSAIESERRLTAAEVTLDFIRQEMERERESIKIDFEREIECVKEELEEERTRIKALEEKVAYYDRAALKYGTVAIVLISIGAYLSAASDKARESIIKLVNLFL